MSHLFISYAREEQPFVRTLHDALTTSGHDTWVDWEGIPPSAEWLQEVYSAIESADAFVFVISPASVLSAMCRKELEHAVINNKRLIPIVYADVDEADVLEPLKKFNWIFIRESDAFEPALRRLLEAIVTDLDWVRQHTRLLVRAREWQSRDKDKSSLLRGNDLRDAEKWYSYTGDREPKPTQLQAQYIMESRRAANRIHRTVFVSLLVGFSIAVVLAAVAFYQSKVAKKRLELAQKRLSALYTEQGRQSLIGGSPARAIVYLSEAYRLAPRLPVQRYLIAKAAGEVTAELYRFEHHSGDVIRDTAFSADGTRVLSAGDDGTVKIWDVESGQLLMTLQGHTEPIWSAVFSPDGRYVATASADHTAKVWDVVSGNIVLTFKRHTAPLQSVEYCPDGTLIVTGAQDRTAQVWEAATGRVIRVFKHQPYDDTVYSAVFDTSGTRVLTQSTYLATLWDLHSGKAQFEIAAHGEMNSALFSQDGKWIITAEHKEARIYDAATGKLVNTLSGHKEKVVWAAFNPEGTRVVTSSWDLTARIWDARRGTLITTLKGHGDWIRMALFSPDGTRVVTASADRTAIVWNATNGRPIKHYENHRDSVWSAVFSPDGSLVLTASRGGIARLWQTRNPQLVATTKCGMSPAFSKDGTRIGLACRDHSVHILDAQNGEVLHRLRGHSGFVNAIDFAPSGSRLLTASNDSNVKIWNVNTGDLILSLQDRKDHVNSGGYSPDGAYIVTSGKDGFIKIRNASNGEIIYSLFLKSAWLGVHIDQVPPANAAKLNIPGGRGVVVEQVIWLGPAERAGIIEGDIILTFNGKEINSPDILVELVSERRPGDKVALDIIREGQSTHIELMLGALGGVPFDPEFPFGTNYPKVAFSPDASKMLTYITNSLNIWETATGDHLGSIRGNSGWVETAEFSADGKLILTGSRDGTAKIWDAATGQIKNNLNAHKSGVLHAVFDPRGLLVATGERDPMVRLWDASSGRLISILEGHVDLIFDVAFSHKGHFIATASHDGTAKLWDVSTGKLLTTFVGEDEWMSEVVFSPDEARLMIRDIDANAYLWDIHQESRDSKEISAIVEEYVLFRLVDGNLVEARENVAIK